MLRTIGEKPQLLGTIMKKKFTWIGYEKLVYCVLTGLLGEKTVEAGPVWTTGQLVEVRT